MLSKQLRLLLAFAVLGIIGSGPSEAVEPLQRTLRFFGIGWGDGYHTCANGGCRPGADLTPRTFYDQYGRRGFAAGRTGMQRQPVAGPTVYAVADSSYGVGGTKYARCRCGAGSMGDCGCASAPMGYYSEPAVSHPAAVPQMQHAHTPPQAVQHAPTPAPIPAPPTTPAEAMPTPEPDPEPSLLDENDLEEEPASPSDLLLMRRRINANFAGHSQGQQTRDSAQPANLQRAPTIGPRRIAVPVYSNQPMVRQAPYRIPVR